MANLAIYTRTVVAAVPLTALRGVTIAGVLPAAGGYGLGISRTNALVGDQVAVDVMGSAMAETGGAIAAGAAVEFDGLGRVVTNTSGVKVGRLAPFQAAATAAGQSVEILLIPN